MVQVDSVRTWAVTVMLSTVAGQSFRAWQIESEHVVDNLYPGQSGENRV